MRRTSLAEVRLISALDIKVGRSPEQILNGGRRAFETILRVATDTIRAIILIFVLLAS